MDFFADHTLRVVALGSGVLGVTSGVLGSFAVLRRQSLIGDALSHAALPGIALAFLLTASKAPLVIMLGAALAGWLGTAAIRVVVRRSRVPFDAALGMLLSVFFGLGLVLLTYIQKKPNAAQAGLDTYLFGQAAALLEQDVVAMAALSVVALVAVLLLWKELKLLSFDPEFGASLGFRMRRVDGAVTGLLVIAVVVGLQTVGVVLMSAMLIAPAVGARQWTERLGTLVALAGAFGAVAGVAGSVISSVVPKLPTGPTIVLLMSVGVVASLLLAPRRGLLWRRVRLARARRVPRLDPVLMHLYALSLQHADDPDHGHPIAVLRTMSPPELDVRAALTALEARGLARQVARGRWAPSEVGRREARKALGGGERER